jgi:hypothetical protein
METLVQIAANLRTSGVREDWCLKIESTSKAMDEAAFHLEAMAEVSEYPDSAKHSQHAEKLINYL